jgi:hypothetical protein
MPAAKRHPVHRSRARTSCRPQVSPAWVGGSRLAVVTHLAPDPLRLHPIVGQDRLVLLNH